MKKFQLYDEDEVLQMELKVKTIRQEVANLEEEYEFHNCIDCNRIKCRCSKKSSLRSTTVSVPTCGIAFPNETDKTFNDIYSNSAPPANTLPIPRWCENKASNKRAKAALEKVEPISLKNWIRASIPDVIQSTSKIIFPVPTNVLDEVNYSWPPFPKSIWSDEMLTETIARERILCGDVERNRNSSVEAFFQYFTGKRAISNTTFCYVDG